MESINFRALLASILAIFALALPAHTAIADEPNSTTKVCEDGKPCSTEETSVDEEPTDDDLEDSCEDDGVF